MSSTLREIDKLGNENMHGPSNAPQAEQQGPPEVGTAEPGIIAHAPVQGHQPGARECMVQARRWLVWTANKQPFYPNGQPRHGMLDTEADRASLGTYEDAHNAMLASNGHYEGIGFALGDGWQGIDLDMSAYTEIDG